MLCAWDELLSVLPPWLRCAADKHGPEALQELRLRLGCPPVLVSSRGCHFTEGCVRETDISFVINTASRYSPWTSSGVCQGYLTAPGGHRIGLCGEVTLRHGEPEGIRTVSSLCIRVAKEVPGFSGPIGADAGSVLILGPPGRGKTTLLRDLIRTAAANGRRSVAVADERGELFPGGTKAAGQGIDVLTHCPKVYAMDRLVRTMCPDILAVDEITAREDCEALTRAAWCGVRLFATAHAANGEDLSRRSVYKPLVQGKLFDTLAVILPDRTLQVERMI